MSKKSRDWSRSSRRSIRMRTEGGIKIEWKTAIIPLGPIELEPNSSKELSVAPTCLFLPGRVVMPLEVAEKLSLMNSPSFTQILHERRPVRVNEDMVFTAVNLDTVPRTFKGAFVGSAPYETPWGKVKRDAVKRRLRFKRQFRRFRRNHELEIFNGEA